MNTERKALIQEKNAVNLSLKEYGIRVTKITFIGLSEYVTYRIDTDSNERYLLRSKRLILGTVTKYKLHLV